MASYDRYDDHQSSRTRYYDDRRADRDPRYTESQSNYLRVNSNRDLVPRPREDSDLSVEEIRRDFPPPGYSRDIRRARSAEPGAYYDDYDDRRSQYSRHDRDYDRGYDRRVAKKGASSVYYEEEEKKRARVLSKQEQIIAAIVGGVIAVGGKELYDRREAKAEGGDVHRNALSSAALGAAGALAAYKGADVYNKQAEKKEKKSTYIMHKGRDGRMSEYYDSDEGGDPKEKKGHKNFLESALAAAGLGGAVKALGGGGGKSDDGKSDTRSRRGSRSRSRSKSREGGAGNKVQKAAMASLIAGATEAFRVSREPGGWKGEKAKRVLTAAAGAATIDAAQSQDKAGSKLGLAESVIGGLLGNRLVHGSRKNIEEDVKTGRSRSRSRARSEGGSGGVSGLAALATAGLGAFGAKKIMDNNRSESRSRRRSADSYDSRDGSPDRRRQRSRSRSVVDTARRGLARIGIGSGPAEDDRSDYDSPRGSRRGHRNDYDDDDHVRDRDRGHGRRRDDYDDDRSYRDRSRSRSRARGGGRRRAGSQSGSDTDLGDSSEDERKQRKIRDRRR